MAQLPQAYKTFGPTFIQTTMPIEAGIGETWLQSSTMQMFVYDGIRWVPFCLPNSRVVHTHLGTTIQTVFQYYPFADVWTDCNRLPELAEPYSYGATEPVDSAYAYHAVAIGSNVHFSAMSNTRRLHRVFNPHTTAITALPSFPDLGGASEQRIKPYNVGLTESHHHWGEAIYGSEGGPAVSNKFNITTLAVTTITVPKKNTWIVGGGSPHLQGGSVTYPEGAWWASSTWTWYTWIIYQDPYGTGPGYTATYALQYKQSTDTWPSYLTLLNPDHWNLVSVGACGSTGVGSNCIMTSGSASGVWPNRTTKIFKPGLSDLGTVYSGPSFAVSVGPSGSRSSTKALTGKALIPDVCKPVNDHGNAYIWDALAGSLIEKVHQPAAASGDIDEFANLGSFHYNSAATIESMG